MVVVVVVVGVVVVVVVVVCGVWCVVCVVCVRVCVVRLSEAPTHRRTTERKSLGR